MKVVDQPKLQVRQTNVRLSKRSDHPLCQSLDDVVVITIWEKWLRLCNRQKPPAAFAAVDRRCIANMDMRIEVARVVHTIANQLAGLVSTEPTALVGAFEHWNRQGCQC